MALECSALATRVRQEEDGPVWDWSSCSSSSGCSRGCVDGSSGSCSDDMMLVTVSSSYPSSSSCDTRCQIRWLYVDSRAVQPTVRTSVGKTTFFVSFYNVNCFRFACDLF